MTKIEDLNGKAVLITGASSGIGAALARAFAAQGAKLALHYNSHEDAARTLAAEIAPGSSGAALIRGDLSKRGEAKRVVNEAAAALGGLPFLFLASNEMSRYITGNTVHVNGGMYMP